ncbi:MAG: ECF transporter S component [Nitrososphaerota archaeon]|jgi:uncharacterized membrane protein|nr:ECF transporter S component [Nitrososphaerota archaeon]
MNTKTTPKTTTIITTTALFTTLIFIIISQIPPIPIPATSGYFNIGEVAIYVTALLFGPFVGAFAGGIGAALSDVYLGFTHFAPGTLIIKGTQGAIVGFLNIKLGRIQNTTLRATISITIGGSIMVIGYFIYETLLAILIPGSEIYALLEIPLNIGQMVIGLIIAIPITHTVQRLFPQFKNYL